jgi:chaperonin GroEL
MKSNNKHYIIKSDTVQFHIEKTIKELSILLEETYGPIGKNLLIDSKKTNNPELLQNGSKIIKSLRTSNQFENLIFLLLEDCFQKINNTSGDGTKTFFLITSNLILNSFKYIFQNSYDLETKLAIKKTINYALTILNDKSIAIKNKEFWDRVIERYIPGDDNLQSIFKLAFEKVGKTGSIKIKSETGQKTDLTIENGMQINRGFFSPYFATDTEKMIVDYKQPYVLITSQKITIEDSYLLNLLEPIIYEKRPLLIISPDIDEQALSSLILNKVNGVIDIVYIKLPQNFANDKSIFEDLALYTDAKFINSLRDWKTLHRSHLGKAERVLVTKTKTIIWSSSEIKQKNIQKLYNALKEQILTTNSDYENEKLETRRKNLIGANAIINISGVTELETFNRRSRTELGLTSAKACLYEGILPGGGFSFIHLTEELENWSRSNFYGDSLIGSNIVIKSLIKPLQVLLSQASDKNKIIPKYLTSIEDIKKITDNFTAYDLKQHKPVNMFDSGIIDSFKSIRIALQTSASLTYSILSIATIVF